MCKKFNIINAKKSYMVIFLQEVSFVQLSADSVATAKRERGPPGENCHVGCF